MRSWLTDLLGILYLWVNGILQTQSSGLEFLGSGVSVAYDPATNRNKITIVGSAGTGNVTQATTSTLDHVPVYSTTGVGPGAALKDSAVTIDGSGNIGTSGTVDGVDVSTLPGTISAGDLSTYNSSKAYTDAAILALPSGGAYTPSVHSGTTYTFIAGDQVKSHEFTNAAAITVTVPTNATVAFAIGSRIPCAQGGAGQVTIAGAGVTFKTSETLKITKQEGVITLEKIATDTWRVFGDLELA